MYVCMYINNIFIVYDKGRIGLVSRARPFTQPLRGERVWSNAILASYPGPFTARGARWERDKGPVPVVRACVEFYWNPGKIVFFGIF